MSVIDASVYVALVNAREPGHEWCWSWFEQAVQAEDDLVAPTILLAEVAAALSRGADDPAFAHRVLQQLVGGQVIELVPVTQPLAEQAAAVAADYRLRGCDAVYVALAAQFGDCLVTLDRQQRERAAAFVTTCGP